MAQQHLALPSLLRLPSCQPCPEAEQGASVICATGHLCLGPQPSPFHVESRGVLGSAACGVVPSLGVSTLRPLLVPVVHLALGLRYLPLRAVAPCDGVGGGDLAGPVQPQSICWDMNHTLTPQQPFHAGAPGPGASTR